MDEEETEGERKRRIWRHVGANGSENIYADLFLENCADTSVQCVFVRKECARHDPNENYLYEHPAMYQSATYHKDGHYELPQDEELAELKFD